MKLALVLLGLVLAQDTQSFFLGLIEGLQKEKDEPSRCLEQFSAVTEAFVQLDSSSGLETVLVQLRNSVNELTLFEQICGFRSVLEQLAEALAGNNLEELGLRIVTNVTFYTNATTNLVTALANRIWYDVGWSLGELLAKTFNFYIR